jgi:two-component system phosphate regulon sensor histidine kinase PhoR
VRVRRAAFILVASAALLGASIWRSLESQQAPLSVNWPPGAVPLAALATALAIFGLLALKLGCRRLARNLMRQPDAPIVESSHPDLKGLCRAITRRLQSAAEALGRAQVRSRELELQLRIVMAERDHAESIIRSFSDAVLVTDAFDELVLANESAARTLGFDPATARRSPIASVLRDQSLIGLMREMRQSGSTGGRRIVEHRVGGAGGERIYKATLSCIAAPDGQPAGVVAVLHDITREKEVAQMKNEFVSNVSHELRTPLASIKAYVEMLLDGEVADEKTMREFHEIIQSEANRLGRLIDNLLNISRIESGLVKISKKPLSLTTVVKEALEVIAPQARQKDIAIIEKISPAVYQTLADHDMLCEAVLNLLSNAVKYTPAGGRITVQTSIDETKRSVAVRISDSGVGIPAKDLPFVFDKFYRSESNSRMAKGTGLGLSLVKHIVESVHQGRLFVDSEVGVGSTFGFELDLIE